MCGPTHALARMLELVSDLPRSMVLDFNTIRNFKQKKTCFTIQVAWNSKWSQNEIACTVNCSENKILRIQKGLQQIYA